MNIYLYIFLYMKKKMQAISTSNVNTEALCLAYLQAKYEKVG